MPRNAPSLLTEAPLGSLVSSSEPSTYLVSARDFAPFATDTFEGWSRQPGREKVTT